MFDACAIVIVRFERMNEQYDFLFARMNNVCKRRLTFFDVARPRTRHIRDSATRNEQHR